MRLTLALTLLLTLTAAAQDARVDRILRDVPLIDGHNDLPWQYRERVKNQLAKIDIAQDQSKLEKPLHTDIARLREGRVGGQFWSVYVPASLKGADAVQATLEQIDVVNRLDRALSGDVRAGAHRGRHRAHPQVGQDRLADRRRGRSLDQQLPRRAAAALPGSARAT